MSSAGVATSPVSVAAGGEQGRGAFGQVPAPAAAIVARWAADRGPHEWLFATATGTAMREGNWQRQVARHEAKTAVGRPTLRVHDLRHTAASIWLGSGADPEVVERILGHASATTTTTTTATSSTATCGPQPTASVRGGTTGARKPINSARGLA